MHKSKLFLAITIHLHKRKKNVYFEETDVMLKQEFLQWKKYEGDSWASQLNNPTSLQTELLKCHLIKIISKSGITNANKSNIQNAKIKQKCFFTILKTKYNWTIHFKYKSTNWHNKKKEEANINDEWPLWQI